MGFKSSLRRDLLIRKTAVPPLAACKLVTSFSVLCKKKGVQLLMSRYRITSPVGGLHLFIIFVCMCV